MTEPSRTSGGESSAVALGADHAGFALKQRVAEHLRATGFEVLDLGPQDDHRVDYPDYAARVAQAVLHGRARFGVLVCGTGIGMSMTANRFPGVRAALVHDDFTARMARAHNDAQIVCLGARVLTPEVALVLVDTFLAEPFAGGRHAGRIARIHRWDVGAGDAGVGDVGPGDVGMEA